MSLCVIINVVNDTAMLNASSKPHSCHHIIHLAANCLLRMLSHSMSHSIIGMLSTSFHVTFYNWSGGWWLVAGGGGDDGGAKEQNDSDCSYRGWLDQHSNV